MPRERRATYERINKALSKAIRATFEREAAIQRCQIHKARRAMLDFR